MLDFKKCYQGQELFFKKGILKIFSGFVDVDETKIGGQWKNKQKSIPDHGTEQWGSTKKEPVFGILFREWSDPS